MTSLQDGLATHACSDTHQSCGNSVEYSRLNVNRQDKFSLDRERGARLRATRLEIGLNQTDLAKIGGCNLNTQGRYEAGAAPPLEYLLRIGEAGADWIWIVTGQRRHDLLSASETALLDSFRSIPLSSQVALRTIAEQLAGHVPDVVVTGGDGQTTTIIEAKVHSRSQGYRAEE